ncbi:MAG: TonB-dependent receptor [Burkholderiales bacterium RIFCSPHIGHO2_12_FULL_69_20]|nr:MAG: TonB-dependent receptor [Burkholderiales bacterium RIFCSPHIGHO2_12_FULL_69_20]
MTHDDLRLPLLGALAAGFGLIGLAQAQTAPITPPPPEPAAESPQVMPVVRAKASAVRSGKDHVQALTTGIGKGTQELRDIPQSLTVVTERLIDDRNLDTLKEALHNTAGISFQAAEGGEEDIRLRGFSLQSTGDIFIDGLRDPAFYDRDTFNHDRLEVLRGSASMLFGRGSTGGAVNQVNKQPLLFGRNEVSVTLGSGGYVRGTTDLNIRLGENSAARINGMLTQADNHGDRIDKEGLAASLGFGIGTTDEVTASVYHLKNDNGIHYGMPWLTPSTGSTVRVLVPVPAANYYAAASDFNRGTADYATLAHTHRFGAGRELKTVLRLGRYERDLRASAIRFAAASLQPDGQAVTAQTLSAATVLNRGNNVKIQDLETVNLQSDFSGRFQALGLRHQLLAGVDATREDFNNYGANAITKPRTTIGTPNDGGGIDESLRMLTRNRTFESNGLGAYAQDLMQVAPDWKLLLGLRWDRFSGHYTTPQLINANTGAITAPTDRARSDALWSKRLGVLYQPTAFQSWHFSYGTSFNTSGDTYQYDALGSNTPPEGSVNYELGGKFDLADGNLSLRFALFHAVKTNERNRDSESVTPTTYVLSGQRHAAGIEFDVAGRINQAWEVFASYAYIPDAEVDKGVDRINGAGVVTCVSCSLQGEPVGVRPGLIPRHSGTVWTTYQLTPHWRLGGGVNARSSMAPYQVTNFTAPSYVTADLMAEYTINDLSFKLNLNNVTDKLYADMLYRGHYIPGKARTVQLTGTYRF